MKTTKELHIDFDLKWNNLSSFKFRALESYEKDWFLNKAYLAYVKTKTDELRSVTGGIKNSTIRLEELSPILEIVSQPMYKEKDNLYYSFLPPNHFNELGESLSHYCCIKGKEFVETNVEYQSAAIKFNDIKWGSSNLTFKIYADFIKPDLSTATINLFTLSEHTTIPITIDYRFYLINLILQEINRVSKDQVDVYWERFNNTYVPNNFIFVTINNVNKLSAIRFEYDLTISGTDTSLANTTILKQNLPADNTLTVCKSDCRLVDNEILGRLNKNPFSRTSKESPLAYLKGDKIYIESKDFVPKEIELTFYRKPNMLNYEMEKNPELGVRDSLDHVSDKLVSEACAFALIYLQRDVNNIKTINKEND